MTINRTAVELLAIPRGVKIHRRAVESPAGNRSEDNFCLGTFVEMPRTADTRRRDMTDATIVGSMQRGLLDVSLMGTHTTIRGCCIALHIVWRRSVAHPTMTGVASKVGEYLNRAIDVFGGIDDYTRAIYNSRVAVLTTRQPGIYMRGPRKRGCGRESVAIIASGWLRVRPVGNGIISTREAVAIDRLAGELRCIVLRGEA